MLERRQRHLIRRAYDLASPLPAGRWLFSRFLGLYVPYSGTTGFVVEDMGDGHATVKMEERAGIRNHLDSIHAVALVNLGELATGLAIHSTLPAQGRAILRRLSAEYLKKARGKVVARCEVSLPSESGKHDVEATATLKDGAGEVVTIVTALWRVQL